MGITLGGLARAMETRVLMDPADPPVRGRIRSIMEALGHMGLIYHYSCMEGGESSMPGEPVFLLTRMGEMAVHKGDLPEVPVGWEDSFYLQADYQVFVPRNLEPRLMWVLDMLCDLEKSDQVLIYRLSPEKVRRASHVNLPRGRVLDFLKQHVKGDLPQNVEFSVTEWTDERAERLSGSGI